MEWHLLTGDYPPARGGVADYTALLAGALVAAGCSVHVWCRGDDPAPADDPGGARVHRVAGRFGPHGLARLGRELDRFAAPRTLLVQYVPHAFGARAMNLAFAAWVARRARRGDDVRVMFHEVAYPWVARPLRHNLIAAANRLMAAVLLRACRRAYVSIPAWGDFLARLGGSRVPTAWTPIPSNIPAGPEASPCLGGAPVVGHFGTYAPLVTRLLAPVLGGVLRRRADARVLLIGAGGDSWCRELVAGRPDWAGRVDAPGARPGPEVRDLLGSCACLVQPYPDGVSTRRTTIMAALANAVPVVTNSGHLTEPVWAGGPVALAPAGDPGRLAELVLDLLDSPGRRLALGRRGRRLYDERFAIEHTVAALLGPPHRTDRP